MQNLTPTFSYLDYSITHGYSPLMDGLNVIDTSVLVFLIRITIDSQFLLPIFEARLDS